MAEPPSSCSQGLDFQIAEVIRMILDPHIEFLRERVTIFVLYGLDELEQTEPPRHHILLRQPFVHPVAASLLLQVSRDAHGVDDAILSNHPS